MPSIIKGSDKNDGVTPSRRIGVNLKNIWAVGAAFSRDWSYVIEEFIAVESRSDSKSVLREILN